MTDETPVAFLAWDLESRERRPDETEVLEVRRLPFSEALRMTLDGAIRDTSTIATILGAHVKAARGEFPEEVARHLC